MPINYENGLRPSKTVLPHFIRSHSMRSPIRWFLDWDMATVHFSRNYQNSIMKNELDKRIDEALAESPCDEWWDKYLCDAGDIFAGRVVPVSTGALQKLISEAQRRERERIDQKIRTDISTALATAEKAPMGVSEWRAHGEKYGYWEFFEKEAQRREKERICGIIKSRLATLYTLFDSTRGITQDETASKVNELNYLLSKLSNE